MSDFFNQEPVKTRRYEHPGSDKMYEKKERQQEPEKPVGERKYPNSKKMYETQPTDGLPPGTHVIKNHMTGGRVLLQSGYLGENGFKKCLESNHRDLRFAGLKDRNLEGASLNGANFSNSKMSGVNFKKTTAQGADFSNANLHNVNFDGANLMNSSFKGVDLSRCTLRNANLKGVDFRGAVLPTQDMMENADMTNAIMSDSEK